MITTVSSTVLLSVVRRDYRMRVELLASIDYGDTGPQNEHSIVIGELFGTIFEHLERIFYK